MLPNGVKRYTVVLELDCDHDMPVESGYTSTHPEDWDWDRIIKRAVESVGYAKVVTAREIESEAD
jgi:hypothetical protein